MYRLRVYVQQAVLLTCILLSVQACSTGEVKDEHAGHSIHGAGEEESSIIRLNERMRMLANIETDTVRSDMMGEEQVILGSLHIDESKAEVVSARVEGLLDKLYAQNPGEKIRKGQALYAIYSEQLLVAEKEFLYALEMSEAKGQTDKTIEELLRRARVRLQLWGLTRKQIETLASTKKANPRVTFYSPVSGYLTGLRVREGEFVTVGTDLFEITNLSTVWVEAQVYPNELEYLTATAPVEIEFEGNPGIFFKGIPVVRSPSLEKNSKIYLMRYKVENVSGDLKPGMMAYVKLSKEKKERLFIPKTALLLSNNRAVWVETAPGEYEMRMVTTGIENRQQVEVLSGLQEGEVVVTTGAYLLNSKNIIDKGASHTMPGM